MPVMPADAAPPTPSTPPTPPTRSSSPTPPRDATFASLRAKHEAIDLIQSLIKRQIDRCDHERPAPNQAIAGDRDVRQAFWMLLDQPAQRGVFLSACKRREFWPRIRSCIGSPPFSFLRPEDNAMLNPGGIAAGRVNMASDTTIHTSGEIGEGHFGDENERVYQLVVDDNKSSNEIPVVRVRNARRVVIDCKLPRMKLAERSSILKSRLAKHLSQITYPRVGERLALIPNKIFGDAHRVSLVVRTVEARASKSPVARLYCSTF